MTRRLTIAVLCTAIALVAPALAGAAPDAAKPARPSCAEAAFDMSPWALNMSLADRPLLRGDVVTIDLPWLQKASDCCSNAESVCNGQCRNGTITYTCNTTNFGCRIRCFCRR